MFNYDRWSLFRGTLFFGALATASLVASSANSGTLYDTCEGCWNEYFAWSWKHSFPVNSGDLNCESGDGCHGAVWEDGQCDSVHSPCMINDVDYGEALAAAQAAGDDLAGALRYLEQGVALVDVEASLFLLKGCDGTIAASVAIPSRELLERMIN